MTHALLITPISDLVARRFSMSSLARSKSNVHPLVFDLPQISRTVSTYLIWHRVSHDDCRTCFVPIPFFQLELGCFWAFSRTTYFPLDYIIFSASALASTSPFINDSKTSIIFTLRSRCSHVLLKKPSIIFLRPFFFPFHISIIHFPCQSSRRPNKRRSLSLSRKAWSSRWTSGSATIRTGTSTR